jgi:hypothetical protein
VAVAVSEVKRPSRSRFGSETVTDRDRFGENKILGFGGPGLKIHVPKGNALVTPPLSSKEKAASTMFLAYEWICAVDKDDPTTFVPVYLDGDPELPNPRAKILDCEARPKAKFEDECRGLFGLCTLPKTERGLPVPDGVGPEDPGHCKGDRMQPFN